MQTLFDIGLNNAAMILLFAVPAVVASRGGRRPVVAHTLWLLVLLKLITPPLVPISDFCPGIGSPAVKEPLVAASRKLPPPPPRPELLLPTPLSTSAEPSTIAKQLAEISPPPNINKDPAPAPVLSPDSKAASAINLEALRVPPWWRGAILIAWLTGTLIWITWIGA